MKDFSASIVMPAGILSGMFLLLFLVSCEKDDPDLPAVTTLDVENVSHDRAVAGGDVTSDGGGTISQRGVVYGLDTLPDAESHLGKTDDGGGVGTYTTTLTGLEAETTYYVRAYARNSAGTVYGESQAFTTSLDPETVRLQGHIYYSNTTIPVRDVQVTFGDHSTSTDMEGFYRLDDLETGTGLLRAVKDGYDLHEQELDLNYGINVHHVDMYSEQYTHRVYGKITSVPWEEAMYYVAVALMNPDGSLSDIRAFSDQEGNYEMENVPRGDMMIQFTRGDYEERHDLVHVLDGDVQHDTQLYFKRPIVHVNEEFDDVYAAIAFGGGEVEYEGAQPVFARGLVWCHDTIPSVPFNHHTTDGGGEGAFDSFLTSLMPATTNKVRAYATNAYGTSYSEVAYLDTERDKGRPCPDMETFTDPRDNHTYHTVQVGNQCWLVENMRYLPEVHRPVDESVAEAKYYVYGYDGEDLDEATSTENYQNYGSLYNWEAAQDACPPGWKLPGNGDWGILASYVEASYGEFTITNVAIPLKSCYQVNSPLGGDCDTETHPRWNEHEHFYGTNEFGFESFPGGRKHSGGYFTHIGSGGYWWTSTGSGSEAFRRQMHNHHHYLPSAAYDKSDAYSVRCIRE